MRNIRIHKRGGEARRGVIALITVVVLSALILIIGLSATFVGQTDILLTGHKDRGQHALTLASMCTDEALYRLKLDSAYTGGTVPLGTDSCTVTVTGTGSTRTITAVASSAEFTKTIRETITLLQNAGGETRAWRIDTWEEVDP